jgi:hypothetical protein
MSKIALSPNASGTGVFTIASPSGNTDRTLTLPDEVGTVLTSGTPVLVQKGVPAFNIYLSTNQTVSANGWSKVLVNTAKFNYESQFDLVNSKFQPTIAGLYSFHVSARHTPAGYIQIAIYKNGARYTTGSGVGANGWLAAGSEIVDMNGTTDYVEMYIYTDQTTVSGSAANTSFSGILVGEL